MFKFHIKWLSRDWKWLKLIETSLGKLLGGSEQNMKSLSPLSPWQIRRILSSSKLFQHKRMLSWGKKSARKSRKNIFVCMLCGTRWKFNQKQQEASFVIGYKRNNHESAQILKLIFFFSVINFFFRLHIFFFIKLYLLFSFCQSWSFTNDSRQKRFPSFNSSN